MRVRVLAFARARELINAPEGSVDLPAGATLRDAWETLVREHPSLTQLGGSTRLARNGHLSAALDEPLRDGDELALLPPVGGG